MQNPWRNLRIPLHLLMLLLVTMLAACGTSRGVKLVKHPTPVDKTQTLAQAKGTHLEARLIAVNYRNGPLAWTRNADWDEYFVAVQALHGNEPVIVTDVQVIDFHGRPLQSLGTRSSLLRASREQIKIYEEADIKLTAGAPPGRTLALWGAGTGASLAAVPSAGIYTTTAAGTGAVAAASVAIIATPAVVIGALVRGNRNYKVDQEIQQRHSTLPITLAEARDAELDLFFPIAPSPQRVELSYRVADQDYTLVIDVADRLAGLHLPQPGCDQKRDCLGP